VNYKIFTLQIGFV